MTYHKPSSKIALFHSWNLLKSLRRLGAPSKVVKAQQIFVFALAGRVKRSQIGELHHRYCGWGSNDLAAALQTRDQK